MGIWAIVGRVHPTRQDSTTACALTTLTLAAALTAAGAGCGNRPLDPTSAPSLAAPSCRLAHALHEHQFTANPALRATPRDIVVGRLEIDDDTSATGADSSNMGIDRIPYRIDSETEIDLQIGPGTVSAIRLLDASDSLVAEATKSRSAAVRLEAGDYTLELRSDGTRTGHYAALPSACVRGGGARADRSGRGATSQSTPLVSSTPGVYVQELGSVPPAVLAAPTSTTAFVGQVGAGPIGEPIEITSVDDLTSRFTEAALTSPVGVSVEQFFTNGGSTAWVVGTASGAVSDVVGTPAAKTGLYALDAPVDWSILVIPDLATMSPTEAQAVLATAVPWAVQANAFTVIDAPTFLATAAQVADWVSGGLVPALSGAPQSELVLPFAAAYFPQIVAPVAGTATTIAAGGAIAGAYSANDAQGGVWISPAGATSGLLHGATAPATLIEEPTIALLATNRVNAIRAGASVGASDPVVWGARTLGTNTLNGGYVGPSRTDLFLRTSIESSLQWVVFEPNDVTLWQSVTEQVSTFATSLWNDGALTGATPTAAFNVVCNQQNNPPETIAAGLLYVDLQVQITGNPTTTEMTFSLTALAP